jgi:signal transduction histidine kinase
MSPAPVRNLTRAPAARVDHAARLELLESFLAQHEDVRVCAQTSVEWLARHAAVRKSVCLAVDPETSRLAGVAGYGVSKEDVLRSAWPLSDERAPLISTLLGTRPVVFETPRDGTRTDAVPATPLRSGSFVALPLHPGRPRTRGAVGLLLLRAGTEVTPDIGWLATVLGRKIAQIRSRRYVAGEIGRLRRERALFFTVINAVTDPIVLTDFDGRLIVANARAEKLLAAHDGPGEDRRRAKERNHARFAAGLPHAAAGAPPVVRDLWLADPEDGTDLLFEALSTTIEDPRDGPGVVSVLRNITDLRRATEQLQTRVGAATAELAKQNELLRRQAIELEQASRLKSQFLANMSHEFRTPLNAILGYTHMLLQGVSGDLPPHVERPLQRVDSNGRHLLTIINEILDLTRIEAGRMPMQISEFDLNALVPEVMAELDPVIARSSVVVEPRLWPAGLIVRSDRHKVKQVVVNLLSNALKFTSHGRVEIAIRAEADRGTASMAVIDTGIGIAPEHHERIFEDFRQVDEAPSRQFGGTGLGLAICRRLANALRGRITVQSRLGAGSAFTLTIPMDAPP